MNKGIIIDAHSHLWLKQDTVVDGCHIYELGNGRSMFFGNEVQMLPPFMTDGKNSAEVFLSNMNYAQVGGAVVVQEFIDGLQNDYLAQVAKLYPDRFFVMGMADYRLPGFADQGIELINSGFRGLAIPGHRLKTADGQIPLNGNDMMRMFKHMERNDAILSLCLHEDNTQLGELEDVITECPNLRIAIGHFGMATTDGWRGQVMMARHKNVYIESGGITWLYNSEFYPYPSAMHSIREAADMVGIDKLMWGSDYPRTITAITYRMSYDFVQKSDLLTDDEKEAFLGGNAVKLYGFSNLPDLPYIKNMSE